ncbi:glycosyltransferase 87 family protein [Haloechinothrix salitolerans]|uniref:Glycosyltransferase 87 family protein n=1 Tax=Haloechinothrix salitolerans TaxID=926830 RepID=A0ABW2C2Q1_9PSEU
MTDTAERQAHRHAAVRARWLDLAVYVGFTGFAVITALASEFATHRIWGGYAAVGYGLATVHAVVLVGYAHRATVPRQWFHSRWVSVALATVLGLLAPLAHLVLRRLGGGDWSDNPAAWGAQPEVWVIERSALLLLRDGSPYLDVAALDRQPVVDDYTPYGPVMALFGLPRALVTELGADNAAALALTDSRIGFALVAAAGALLAWRLLGRPSVPIGAAQLALVSPATALTFAAAGPDLAVLGLLLVAIALAARGNPITSGLTLALVVSAKLTAAPAILVLLILLVVRYGARVTAAFAGALFITGAAVTVPFLATEPRAFVENVLRFPLGAAEVASPAASPLPGHLLASTGPLGHALALTLLGVAAVAITGWLVLRPPMIASDAALRIAVGLGAATLLTPATRWGYLVYPLVLLGAWLCFRGQPTTAPHHTRPRAG